MYSLLCLIYLAAISPALTSLLDNTTLKTIVAGGLVAVFTQLVKRYIAGDSPWIGIVTNALTSLAAIFISTNHAALFTNATGLQVLAIFATAAGLHSTVRSLSPKLPDAPNPAGVDLAPVSPTAKATGLTVVLLAAAMVLTCSVTGCKATVSPTPATAPTLPSGAVDQVDAKANQNLQAIHGFLLSVSSDIQSGKVTVTADQLKLVDQANSAVNVADAAEQAYHNAGGGSASVLNAAMTAVTQAFTAVQSSLAATASGK